MFVRSISSGLALLAVLIMPCMSLAGEGEFSRSGFYLGLAGNTSFATSAEDTLSDLTALPVKVDPSLGLHARAGYRLHPRFAAEAHYEWNSGFDVSALGFNAIDISGHTVTADFKGFLLTGRIQPFAMVGLGTTIAELNDTIGAGFSIDEAAFAARFGGGADFYLTETLAVTLDTSYVLPTGNLGDFDYVSVGWGLQYRFDGVPFVGR